MTRLPTLFASPRLRPARHLLPLAAVLLAACSSPSTPSVGLMPLPPKKAVVAPQPLSLVVESPVVAARFPDVGPHYAVPALRPGHAVYTSQAEMQAVMAALAVPPRAEGTPRVSVLALGASQGGVPLEALLLTRHAASSPAALTRGGRPTVLLVGQQHGDEYASSEALLALAQSLATGSLNEVLERINVIIVPRANPDGAAHGWAATANGVDLDQDHLLLRTPEAQGLAQLTRDYTPAVVVDVREYALQPAYVQKLGAAQRADAQVQYATTGLQHAYITKAAEEWLRQPLVASLKAQGLSVEWHHRLAAEGDDKSVHMGDTGPESLRNAQGLRHAVSLLVETRGVGLGAAHLQRRVHTQVVMLSSILQSTAQRAPDLLKLRKFVEADVRAQACRGQMAVRSQATASEYELALLDPLTGADKAVWVNWYSALALQTVKQRARPCGYWLAAEEQATVQRLRKLGLRVDQLLEPATLMGETDGTGAVRVAAVASAAAPAVTPVAASASGATAAPERAPGAIDAPRGSYYVPLSQPLALLAVAALDADAQPPASTPSVVGVRVMAGPKLKRSAVP